MRDDYSIKSEFFDPGRIRKSRTSAAEVSVKTPRSSEKLLDVAAGANIKKCNFNMNILRETHSQDHGYLILIINFCCNEIAHPNNVQKNHSDSGIVSFDEESDDGVHDDARRCDVCIFACKRGNDFEKYKVMVHFSPRLIWRASFTDKLRRYSPTKPLSDVTLQNDTEKNMLLMELSLPAVAFAPRVKEIRETFISLIYDEKDDTDRFFITHGDEEGDGNSHRKRQKTSDKS